MNLSAMIAVLLQARPAEAATCGACHRAQFHAYERNTMSRALYRAADAEPLREYPKLTFRLGRFNYLIERRNYTVTDGESKFSAPLLYAFGQGAAGQTYVFRHEGRWYESRISFYSKTKSLDLTMGAPPGEPKTLLQAAGREMTPNDVVACFACHTTNSIQGGAVDFERLQAGVGCENCHGPAAKHAQAFKTGNVKEVVLPKLARLSTEEQSDLCGRCHRTWGDIASNGPRGIGNVRFQPYRIANSKCYDAADRRIACTACHDAHQALEHDLTAYDRNCLACHAKGQKAKICSKQAASGCVSCHMPRYEIPGSHHLFTDHQIRIVRPNEAYPN